MSSLCRRSVQFTCCHSSDLLFPVLVGNDGSLRLPSLSVTGVECLVSGCVRDGFNQYAAAPVAAASQVPALSLWASRVPSLFGGPVSEGAVLGSFVAGVPVSSQSSLPGGTAVESLVSTEPAVCPLLPSRKSIVAPPGEKLAKIRWKSYSEVTEILRRVAWDLIS